MERLRGRRAWLAAALVLVLVIFGAGSALAKGKPPKKTKPSSLHITVAPKSGKVGTKYNVNVKGKAPNAGTELALGMTLSPGTCPTDFATASTQLAPITNTKGKPVPPKHAKKNLKLNVHAKMALSQAGTYGICAYLVLGSDTVAHASSSFTVTG